VSITNSNPLIGRAAPSLKKQSQYFLNKLTTWSLVSGGQCLPTLMQVSNSYWYLSSHILISSSGGSSLPDLMCVIPGHALYIPTVPQWCHSRNLGISRCSMALVAISLLGNQSSRFVCGPESYYLLMRCGSCILSRQV
jgi:hypothetical protein